jgi:hypothetical protein
VHAATIFAPRDASVTRSSIVLADDAGPSCGTTNAGGASRRTAKLRVLRRDDGSTLTPIGTSAAITGTGSREIYTVHLPVPNGATIGLDLNGSMAAVAGTAETVKAPGVVADNTPLSGTTIDVFRSSTRGSGNMTRQFSLPDGIPAIVGRNGTVKVHGDNGPDEVRFEATFRRNGTAKGYLSLWYYQLGVNSEGKLTSDPYLGASNWTAKRV